MWNRSLLESRGKKHVVQYRDLRDVAVSWYYFTRRRRENAEMGTLKGMSVEEGIQYFIDNKLGHYCKHVADWRKHRHPDLSFEVRYEQLVDQPTTKLAEIAAFLGFPTEQRLIERIVQANSFERVSGRRRGAEDTSSHMRKGIVGDWENSFSRNQRDQFMDKAGGLLEELGYC